MLHFPKQVKKISPVDAFLADGTKSLIREITIPPDNFSVGKRIVDLHFPRTAIIAMISRNGKFLTPNGATEIQEEDTLIVLMENRKNVEAVYNSLHLTYDPENIEEENL